MIGTYSQLPDDLDLQKYSVAQRPVFDNWEQTGTVFVVEAIPTDEIITNKVQDLKLKVALGTATDEDKENLQLLTA